MFIIDLNIYLRVLKYIHVTFMHLNCEDEIWNSLCGREK